MGLGSQQWAPDRYVLATTLGYVNPDMSLHVYGPTTLDAAVTHARTLGHQPVVRVERAMLARADCARCQLSLSDAAAPYFFGRMLDEACPR